MKEQVVKLYHKIYIRLKHRKDRYYLRAIERGGNPTGIHFDNFYKFWMVYNRLEILLRGFINDETYEIIVFNWMEDVDRATRPLIYPAPNIPMPDFRARRK
jgi:hypothetical protein